MLTLAQRLVIAALFILCTGTFSYAGVPCQVAHNCKKVYSGKTCSAIRDACISQTGMGRVSNVPCYNRWDNCMKTGNWPMEAGPGKMGLKRE